jgi:hypothetical protein
MYFVLFMVLAINSNPPTPSKELTSSSNEAAVFFFYEVGIEFLFLDGLRSSQGSINGNLVSVYSHSSNYVQ